MLTTLSAFTSGTAAQQPAAGADDMRSMYCVEVLRAEIDLQHHMIAASDEAANSAATPTVRQQWIDTSSELLQGLARLEVLRYRLQTYMLPRIHTLDSFALAAAIREGEADFEASRIVADASSALTRVSACQNPTWLPPEH